MPRYFFHLRDGRDYPDTEGTELPDLEAARLEAVRTSGEMLSGHKGAEGLWSGDDWTMNVVGEEGRPLLTLRFSATQHV